MSYRSNIGQDDHPGYHSGSDDPFEVKYHGGENDPLKSKYSSDKYSSGDLNTGYKRNEEEQKEKEKEKTEFEKQLEEAHKPKYDKDKAKEGEFIQFKAAEQIMHEEMISQKTPDIRKKSDFDNSKDNGKSTIEEAIATVISEEKKIRHL